MVPKIIRTSFFEVDGPAGIDVVPMTLVDGTFPEVRRSDDLFPVPDPLQPVCENNRCHSVTKRFGWCARMQEPGCLDSTRWVGFRTEREALEHLLETYGQWETVPEAWQRDLENRLANLKVRK